MSCHPENCHSERSRRGSRRERRALTTKQVCSDDPCFQIVYCFQILCSISKSSRLIAGGRAITFFILSYYTDGIQECFAIPNSRKVTKSRHCASCYNGSSFISATLPQPPRWNLSVRSGSALNLFCGRPLVEQYCRLGL